MNGVRVCLLSLAAAAILASPCRAQDLVVNGYTYVAPSLYPAPPVVVYDPAFVVPTRTVIQPINYVSPARVVYTPTYVTSYPTGVYAPVMVGPTAVRQRAWYSRNGLKLTVKEYVPGRAAPVHTYRVDSERGGVRVRERFR
jgi:hypothetical protein